LASVRFTDVQARPTEFLDLTSLTLDGFQLLVPPFEAAFQAHMSEWRLDGKPRTARRFTVYKNCPLVLRFINDVRVMLPSLDRGIGHLRAPFDGPRSLRTMRSVWYGQTST